MSTSIEDIKTVFKNSLDTDKPEKKNYKTPVIIIMFCIVVLVLCYYIYLKKNKEFENVQEDILNEEDDADSLFQKF